MELIKHAQNLYSLGNCEIWLTSWGWQVAIPDLTKVTDNGDNYISVGTRKTLEQAISLAKETEQKS